MLPKENIIFYDGATAVSLPSKEYHNVTADSMAISVSGTFTGAEFVFEGKTDINDAEWRPIDGVKKSGLTVGNNFTDAGLYTVSVDCLQRFRVRLTKIGTGSITIFGRAIQG